MVARGGRRLVERLHADAAEVLAKIKGGDWSDETQEALRSSIETFVDDFGYDLDEEGHPLTDESDIQAEEGRRKKPSESEEDEEREPVGAEA